MLQANEESLKNLLLTLRGSYLSFGDDVRQLEICTYLLEMVIGVLDSPDSKSQDKIHLLVTAFLKEFQDYSNQMRKETAYYRELINDALSDLETTSSEDAYACKNRA